MGSRVVETVIFSAHCDDAALSVGGAIAESIFGDAVVVVVNSISNYVALGLQGRDTEIVTRCRKQEEINALSPYLKGVYFLDYKDHCVETGDVCLKASRVYEAIYAECLKYYLLGANRFLFPVGVGNHPDHIMLSEIGLRLQLKSAVWFYEDLPYAIEHDPLLILPSGLKRKVLESRFSLKFRLLRHYSSQGLGMYYLSMESYHNLQGGEVIYGRSDW
jgi:LmbE family N-acetylglucosaminyl deacetylase